MTNVTLKILLSQAVRDLKRLPESGQPLYVQSIPVLYQNVSGGVNQYAGFCFKNCLN
jgi:hypothetical protein